MNDFSLFVILTVVEDTKTVLLFIISEMKQHLINSESSDDIVLDRHFHLQIQDTWYSWSVSWPAFRALVRPSFSAVICV